MNFVKECHECECFWPDDPNPAEQWGGFVIMPNDRVLKRAEMLDILNDYFKCDMTSMSSRGEPMHYFSGELRHVVWPSTNPVIQLRAILRAAIHVNKKPGLDHPKRILRGRVLDSWFLSKMRGPESEMRKLIQFIYPDAPLHSLRWLTAECQEPDKEKCAQRGTYGEPGRDYFVNARSRSDNASNAPHVDVAQNALWHQNGGLAEA